MRRLYFILYTAAAFLIYFLYLAFLIRKPVKINPKKNLYTNDEIRYILYWTRSWSVNDFYIGTGFKPFKKCKYKNCYATANRTYIPMEEFDALLFHGMILDKQKYRLPSERYSHQRYIFVQVEAPANWPPKLQKFASFYNWTMTYRYDSDLVRRHGYSIKERTDYIPPTKAKIRTRKKFAAWFVSHCPTSSKREVLKALQNYIPLDVYGKCGNLTCGSRLTKTSSKECLDMVSEDYKFYLAFENSFCKDYTTEKLYNMLARDVVPVVYGFDDYTVSAPPHSVINVADFNSVQELAEYLKYLSENLDEYLKYFEWKKNFRIYFTRQIIPCQLCEKLNKPLRNKVYKNLQEWWCGKDGSMCKIGNSLPKIVRDLL